MRGRFVLVSLVLLGAIGMLAYSNTTRTPAKPMNTIEPATAASAAPDVIAPSATMGDSGNVTESSEAGPSSAITAEEVEEWIADSLSEDRDKRSAAIIALAHAPREQAVPVLREVLELGDAEPDRQLALRSLHTLAMDQGDADSLIRDTFRQAMYHGNDEAVTQSAQAYLDDVEAALEQRPSP